MNALNIRTWADARAFAYVLLPVIATLLVSQGLVAADKIGLWVGLASAILGPVIAFLNARSVSLFRAAFYAVLGAAQAVIIGYGLASQALFDQWTPLVVAVIGLTAGGVAAANTDTSPA